MNKKHYAVSIAIWVLVSFAVGCAFTAHVMGRQTEEIMSRDREALQIAEAQASTCRNTVNLMTAKSTVLYEAAPAGVEVLHGIARVEAGSRVISPVFYPRQATWILPFALKPQAMPGTRGAAYAYMDKSGGVSPLIELR